MNGNDAQGSVDWPEGSVTSGDLELVSRAIRGEPEPSRGSVEDRECCWPTSHLQGSGSFRNSAITRFRHGQPHGTGMLAG